MGCASSKRTEARVDVYRPPPTSFAVFDVNSIEEPWVVVDNSPPHKLRDDGVNDRPNPRVPLPILEKLDKIDSADAPQSWVDVSKSLSLLQLDQTLSPPPAPAKGQVPEEKPKASAPDVSSPQQQKSLSFHTVEELDAKMKPTDPKATLKTTESMKSVARIDRKPLSEPSKPGAVALEGVRSVKENIFILRDRMEREKEGKAATPRWDPLSDFPYKCPPRGEDRLVVYTTSLGGVRRTYEDCNRMRLVLDSHGAVYDERDVALHGEFLSELRELLGEEAAAVPRVFLSGRYLGGVEELEGLNDSGRFGRMLRYARIERGAGRRDCEGCGGGRFVPCMECGGSCKVVVGDEKGRCGKCNENGLVHCPLCL
ncbi:hypothetical protein MLD38_023738 [Melastoma candidum]|uniref:Uncharacterized protein n=1 Tax=Melastoma candidum TaxID=119954 RepID=A0ACB9NQA5_9MYRT|nr:hypothetical protein MLD38_023738 [Melastoma candidum]